MVPSRHGPLQIVYRPGREHRECQSDLVAETSDAIPENMAIEALATAPWVRR